MLSKALNTSQVGSTALQARVHAQQVALNRHTPLAAAAAVSSSSHTTAGHRTNIAEQCCSSSHTVCLPTVG